MSDSNKDTEEEEHEHDGPITHNPNVRAKWLSTIIAIPIALHYPALVIAAALGIIDIGAIPQPWFLFDTLGWIAVMTYIFGERTIKAGRQALGKD